jgi:tetratricopeptide (TPR) repeat protein
MPSSKIVQALVLAVMVAAVHFAFPQRSSGAPQSLAGIESALRSGNFDQADQLTHAAIERWPQDPRLWALRGMALAGAQKPTFALSAYQHSLQLAPNYLPALEGAAQIEYQRGSDKAKPLLGRILDTDPANTTAHAMLAMIALKAHDCPEAVRHFRRATPAINSQPSALNAYGYCLANLSRFEEAIPILAQVVALNQNESARYNLALAQWQAGHGDDSLKTLQPLLDGGTTDEDILTLAADVEESMNHTPRATELLRAAILANPQKVEGYLHFTTLASNHKSYQVGIDMLNAGLTQIPHAAALYLARGILNAQLGLIPKAMDDFETAERYDPQLSFLGTAEGVAETQNDKFGEAIEKFRTQARKHPDDALTQCLLAESLSATGATEGSPEYREEITAANRALKLDPKSATAHDLLAGAYLRAAKTDLAIEHSEAALRIDSQDQEAVYHLILALRKTDRKAEIPALTERLVALRQAGPTQHYQLVEAPAAGPETAAKH